MARFLPPHASLEHLRNEAQALLKAHRQGQDGEAAPVLRHLHRFAQAGERDLQAATVSLAEMQFALAQDYGFAGWAELRRAVLGTGRSEQYAPAVPQPDAWLLAPPPPGRSPGNRFAGLYSLALAYLGLPGDYHDLLGDSGLAFILQADSLHHPYGRHDIAQLDIGWWPNDPWGAALRLDFLRDVYGLALRVLPFALAEFMADPRAHYARYHEAEVLASLRAGYPVLAFGPEGCLVTGFDSGTPPLLGQLGCVPQAELKRLDQYPWHVVLLEEAEPRLERRAADASAIAFALRLGHDQLDLAQLPGKSSGQRSWQLWLEQLASEELCGPHFYHANVVGNLRQNRLGAEVYLRQMAARHEAPVQAALLQAAGRYRQVADGLAAANTGKEALGTAAGRQALGRVIEAARELETQALAALAEAAALV